MSSTTSTTASASSYSPKQPQGAPQHTVHTAHDGIGTSLSADTRRTRTRRRYRRRCRFNLDLNLDPYPASPSARQRAHVRLRYVRDPPRPPGRAHLQGLLRPGRQSLPLLQRPQRPSRRQGGPTAPHRRAHRRRPALRGVRRQYRVDVSQGVGELAALQGGQVYHRTRSVPQGQQLVMTCVSSARVLIQSPFSSSPWPCCTTISVPRRTPYQSLASQCIMTHRVFPQPCTAQTAWTKLTMPRHSTRTPPAGQAPAPYPPPPLPHTPPPPLHLHTPHPQVPAHQAPPPPPPSPHPHPQQGSRPNPCTATSSPPRLPKPTKDGERAERSSSSLLPPPPSSKQSQTQAHPESQPPPDSQASLQPAPHAPPLQAPYPPPAQVEPRPWMLPILDQRAAGSRSCLCLSSSWRAEAGRGRAQASLRPP